MFAVAVNGVADQGMRDLREMPPDLMHPPGVWLGSDKRVASARVGPDGMRKLDRSDSLIMSQRGLSVVFPIDRAFALAPAARDAVIGFRQLVRLKKLAHQPSRFSIQCKKKHAGRGTIQSMHRINVAIDLPPQLEEAVKGSGHTMTLILRLVDLEPGGLIDRDEPFILVKNPKPHDGLVRASPSLVMGFGYSSKSRKIQV